MEIKITQEQLDAQDYNKPLMPNEEVWVKNSVNGWINTCPMCKYDKMSRVAAFDEKGVFHDGYTRKECDACRCPIYYNKEQKTKLIDKYTQQAFDRRKNVPESLWNTRYH